MAKPISINDAAELGLSRLRLERWKNPMDHIQIDIFDGKIGPWIHLYSPFNRECNGRDPVDMIFTGFDLNSPDWLIYTGPLPDSEEYKAAVACFDGCLAELAKQEKA